MGGSLSQRTSACSQMWLLEKLLFSTKRGLYNAKPYEAEIRFLRSAFRLRLTSELTFWLYVLSAVTLPTSKAAENKLFSKNQGAVPSSYQIVKVSWGGEGSPSAFVNKLWVLLQWHCILRSALADPELELGWAPSCFSSNLLFLWKWTHCSCQSSRGKKRNQFKPADHSCVSRSYIRQLGQNNVENLCWWWDTWLYPESAVCSVNRTENLTLQPSQKCFGVFMMGSSVVKCPLSHTALLCCCDEDSVHTACGGPDLLVCRSCPSVIPWHQGF